MSVVVQISGRVLSPGTYLFDQPVSVSDAVARAGGLVAGLQPETRWAGLLLDSGRHLHIAAGRDGSTQMRLRWMAVPSLLVLGIPLDVNCASVEELGMIPGINKRLAERIVARRRQLGRFSRHEELLSVYGIGPVSLKRLRSYLEVSPDIS
jgi:competence protein ComEA